MAIVVVLAILTCCEPEEGNEQPPNNAEDLPPWGNHPRNRRRRMPRENRFDDPARRRGRLPHRQFRNQNLLHGPVPTPDPSPGIPDAEERLSRAGQLPRHLRHLVKDADRAKKQGPFFDLNERRREIDARRRALLKRFEENDISDADFKIEEEKLRAEFDEIDIDEGEMRAERHIRVRIAHLEQRIASLKTSNEGDAGQRAEEIELLERDLDSLKAELTNENFTANKEIGEREIRRRKGTSGRLIVFALIAIGGLSVFIYRRFYRRKRKRSDPLPFAFG